MQVSLAKANIDLIAKRRYFATWKADGTRFLLLILRFGAYLLNRSMQVRRVQVSISSPAPLHHVLPHLADP